jgi:hypothetical protein
MVLFETDAAEGIAHRQQRVIGLNRRVVPG